mmetsp:Transcript_6466/g.13362  ORF Transcript_6466/g.13362 Transcript_6466/m.13362 type:complete len:214 (-) Transcript_6466:230-871(-)
MQSLSGGSSLLASLSITSFFSLAGVEKVSLRTARPASRKRAAQSAPLYPSAFLLVPIFWRSTSGEKVILSEIALRMETRSSGVGNETYKSLSKRPGRIIAGSMSSGRLVAAITKTLLRLSSPSISVRSWFTTLSLTPLPLLSPPRLGQRLSSSSKKTTQGEEARARSNTNRTERSLSPTYLSNNSGPLTLMKLAPLSLAIALASSVFPQPGGP